MLLNKKKRGRPCKTDATKKRKTSASQSASTPRAATAARTGTASPRAATAACTRTTSTTKRRFFSTVNKSDTNHSTVDPQTFKLPEERIVLERVRCGVFETVNCSYCSKPTNHHCLIEFPNSKIIDSATKMEICGKPYCNICKFELGVEGGSNCCREHLG